MLPERMRPLILAAAALGLSLAARPAAAAPPRGAAPVARLELTPAGLRLYGSGARDQVYVTAVLSDGSRQDVTEKAVFRALGAAVRASAGGRLEASRDGTAKVSVRYGGGEALLPVTVSGTARPVPVSFRYDVLPVLSRAGCNQGACHGNSEGKGGLKISLKGEDPEGDHHVLVYGANGRRLNPVEPPGSLILQKATASVPHAGGLRFAKTSDEYRTVLRWLSEGARFDPPDAPRLTRLEVRPAERILVAPAQQLRLEAVGHFSDGTVRNLTQKVIFSSGDPLIQATTDGLVRTDRGGDTAVLVRYADQMVNARVTFVPARKAFAWKPVPEQNWIDTLNFRRLKQLRLAPSDLSSDAEFLRRAYLDAIGTLPTPEETRAFLAECEAERKGSGFRVQGSAGPVRTGSDPKDPVRPEPRTLNPEPSAVRSRLIDRLLKRPEFDDVWTMRWASVLRVEERTLDPKGAAIYRDWIRENVAKDRPLDQFARELLVATGTSYSDPATNYYRRTKTADELAETTAQVFMGTRMLCAKCHNHPFERWKQDDYYTLAAFFPRVDREIESVDRKDRFDKHEMIGDMLVTVSPKGEVAHPRTGQPVAPGLPAWLPPIPQNVKISTAAPEGMEDRRIAFAAWLTAPENPFFARAMANRIWYSLLGRGIVDPVDDMRESNPASNPELLDALAKDLAANGYRIRPLVRTIMNSRTYQLSAIPNTTNAEDERFFSRSIPQRLPAEVLLDAISQVAGAPANLPSNARDGRAINMIPVNKQKHPFLTVFGAPARESACECERTNDTTLGQSFTLISGTSLDGMLKQSDNRIGKLLAAGKPDAEIVTEFYLAALSRPPTAKELSGMTRYLATKPERRAALEDALWAIINSKEFLLRR